MENILLTATLYIVVFGILCQFVKTKPAKTANATTASPAIKPVTGQITEPVAIVPPVAPKMPVEPTVKETKPTISALIKDQMRTPTTIINAQSLAAIMEDRNATTPVKPLVKTAKVTTTKMSRNKKTKKSIGGFLREIEALT